MNDKNYRSYGNNGRNKNMENINKNCISYWFPGLRDSGVEVPKTEIIRYTGESLSVALDGKKPDGIDDLISRIDRASEAVGGYPVFLKTGMTSGKFDFENTCLVKDKNQIEGHLIRLVEASELASIWGLPYDVWAVREYLEHPHLFFAFHGKLPIGYERRYFFRDGKVEFHHPYWPPGAIKGHAEPGWEGLLSKINTETLTEITRLIWLSEKVAKNFEGYWSLDWMMCYDQGRYRWVAIDMGLGDQSYRWDEYELGRVGVE